MYATREQIVRDLEKQGRRFHTFVIEDESTYPMEDFEWNQRDVTHIPFVHGGNFHFAPGATDDDLMAGMVLRTIFGIRIPSVSIYYHLSREERVWLDSVGPLMLIASIRIDQVGPVVRTRTTYSLGGHRIFHPLARLAERFIRRNYVVVHDEDEPNYARRSWLRGRGFRFTGDKARPSFLDSLDNAVNHAIPPPGQSPATHTVRIDDGAREWLVGEADHLGVRVIREGDRLLVFPRTCLHQGANLDQGVLGEAGLQCPWHGRLVKPLAVFELNATTGQRLQAGAHSFELIDRVLRIEPAAERQAPAARAGGG